MLPTRVEIIPTEGIVDAISKTLPTSTTVSVTCLPNRRIGPTLRTAIRLAELGYTVVPHLAAKCLESRAELSGILRDCEVAGISEVFAIDGDAAQPAGPYATSGELLKGIAELTGKLSVGVAAYPEGHPNISALHLLDDLLVKQEFAGHIVTQLCFLSAKILEYIRVMRNEGIVLPVWAGVAGSVPHAELVSAAKGLGVGPSLRVLARRGPLARRLLQKGSYSSARLVAELSAVRDVTAGIHIHSFNHLDREVSTESAEIERRNGHELQLVSKEPR